MFTKLDLKNAIDTYTNKYGSYFTPLVNTLMFWRSDTGRGVFRAAIKDSPQYQLIKEFMDSEMVQKLDDNDEVSFTTFYNFTVERDKQHRFSEIYIYGDNAVAILIVRPWFESLAEFIRAEILSANDEIYYERYKSATHQISELKDGMYNSVCATARLVTAPVQSSKNIYEALVHPVTTAESIVSTAYYRPAYALGSHLPGVAAANLGSAIGYAAGNQEIIHEVALHANHAAHVGELSHAGEHHLEKHKRFGNG
jgi:hypothetical protein